MADSEHDDLLRAARATGDTDALLKAASDEDIQE